jgi:hypothetical protein
MSIIMFIYKCIIFSWKFPKNRLTKLDIIAIKYFSTTYYDFSVIGMKFTRSVVHSWEMLGIKQQKTKKNTCWTKLA